MLDFETAILEMPLVAILRGLTASDAEPVGEALIAAGFRFIEVPLNSPDAFTSISTLQATFGKQAIIGAGTVLNEADVGKTVAAGGRLIVMPHCDPDVIRAAKIEGAIVMPGIASPTDAFTALDAGADALKAFPAELLSPKVIRSMKAVLPVETKIIPVGGITPETMPDYVAVGACGFGLGSALFKPGDPVAKVAEQARQFVTVMETLLVGREEVALEPAK